ncbi:MAG TPA: tRNA pseudouridine(55) synthase TruB [Leptospiraceae bacterium]|nr:tRNA pseudouridine(55) synthase TruB [Leptospiraceae bacterium]HMW05362.1 tRNA pseudouridine(55) synthase TruB [Leptospiraceae bacterium]HMX34349.1 tRNA pseudouridine(55) synthase TruB [Leptospiraceae bacterium]HMY31557.1 tRNA pseudouridine(55) synthase TruB [Leptospiraceae bacterium]HNA06711.1 tRNA pseudouridine(55) synthase TruB [Leptospiraceae bacterium]
MKSGFYLVNKPAGITSSDLVLKIKKNKKPIKIGHTGTLDKAAEGLLILPFGDYTAFSSYFLEADKGYYAQVGFGKSTDSGDRDGVIQNEWDFARTKEFFLSNQESIRQEIEKIIDTNLQTPPVISAIKVGGIRQSSLYREGISFESVARKIKIYKFNYENLDETGFTFHTLVSSGTYIRKIVIDLSEKLDFPMYLKKLVRTSLGELTLEKALSSEEILSPDAKHFTLEEMIPYPWIDLNEKETHSVRHGGYVRQNVNGNFLLRDFQGRLLAWCSTEDKKPHLPYKYLKVFYNPDEN